MFSVCNKNTWYINNRHFYKTHIIWGRGDISTHHLHPPGLLLCGPTHPLQGYKHRNAYIATQRPLENTVQDFWRMVWEFKSKVIVMLCQTQEDGKVEWGGMWSHHHGTVYSMTRRRAISIGRRRKGERC